MKDHKISLFPNAYSVIGQPYSLSTFLDNIRMGAWQKHIQKVRICKEEKAQKKLKELLPCVMVSGVFENGKADSDLRQHSDFIAIDLDDVTDLEKVKNRLEQDIYTYAVFTSCRGQGLCVIVRIEGKKHEQAFDGLAQYYFQNYGQIVDPSGRNVSRLRFVSYDPDLRQFEDSAIFKLYPEKEKKRPDTRNIYFGSQDIDHVFDQIQSKQIDITGNYHQWCAIGFALADHYGNAGRDRFLTVSQYSSVYDTKKAEIQYNACLKHTATSSRKVTIATFLWYCKQHGISIVSEQTKAIVQSAQLGKNGSNTIEGTINVLQQIHGIEPEVSRPIVEQVYATPVEMDEDRIPAWVRLEKYFRDYQPGLKRNVLNQEVYRDGFRLTERDIVDIMGDATKRLCLPIGKEMVNDYLKSSGVEEFNPLHSFFETMSDFSQGHIQKLAQSLNCKHGTIYAEKMLRKWLVGCVASAYDEYSSMMLVLTGSQKAGKSTFFKNLLPQQLQCRQELVTPHVFGIRPYQDDLVMTGSWIALDEEFISMEKLGYKRMKAMLTMPTVFIRYNFDKRGQTRSRLCNFAGCANDADFLEDNTGNRRFGVIEVVGKIDFDLYNEIDKYEVWKEAYQLYTQKIDVDLTDEDVREINEVAEEYRQRSKEEELIIKHFTRCSAAAPGACFASATSIGNFLQIYSTYKNLSPDKIGKVMKSLGFENNNGKPMRLLGKTIRGFWVLCDPEKRPSLR